MFSKKRYTLVDTETGEEIKRYKEPPRPSRGGSRAGGFTSLLFRRPKLILYALLGLFVLTRGFGRLTSN